MEALECSSLLIQRYPEIPILHNIAGAVNVGLRRLDDALASYDRAIRIRPDFADAYVNRAMVLTDLKRLDEALASYDKAIRVRPDYAAAHNNRGIVLASLGRLDEALACFDEAIRLKLDHAAVHYNRANALKGLNRLDEALAGYEEAIRIQPDYADARFNRGMVLKDLKRLDEALAGFDRAISLSPNTPALHNTRGVTLADMLRLNEALAAFDEAIRLQPGHADAHYNRGVVLRGLGRLDDALAGLNEAIRLRPDHADAYNNRGIVLTELYRLTEALADYDRVIRLKPNSANAHYNRGNALRDLKRLEEALVSYDEAIRLQPDYAEAHNNRGVALTDLKRLDEAIASFEEALRLKPDNAEILSQLMFQQAQICRWEKHNTVDLSRFGIQGEAIDPFFMLAMEDDPAGHLERAKNWALKKYSYAPRAEFEPASTREKLKIGYFSADFHDHATMYLMAQLFELHEKSRFEIHALSYGRPSEDGMRRRLIDAVDHFHDVSRLTDPAIAAFARDHGVDIAIDLKGYTQDGRSGVFAHRAAPIQINYLGYPGSMGAEFIDYIIADETIIPEQSRQYYSEKTIILPDSYQVNDRSREISGKEFERAELGLPDEGFVFCCFNNSYKITPGEFDIWMRLLAQVDGSVLWLMNDNRWAEANLRREAAARGVDADRLVFAERMPLPEHLARHRNADLFLDTFNYNAHTTASDALWAGLPVVSKLGEGFAARVAGSLLGAIGLSELATDTAAAYEQLALQLATNPVRLGDIRARLAANRMTTPLFDAERFARHIERAYEMAHERYAGGLPPDHIEVTKIPEPRRA